MFCFRTTGIQSKTLQRCPRTKKQGTKSVFMTLIIKNSNFRRAVSQYMQESGSYINPYYGATGQNTFGNSGSDSPTATLALAAYYGSFGAGAGSTPGAGMAGYASYYNNLYYPSSHQSSYAYGSTGSTTGMALLVMGFQEWGIIL